MLYEGTNGIQAMDFLGRKLGLQKGQLFMNLLGEMHKTIAAAKNIPELADNAEKVEAAVNKLGEAAIHIGMKAMSEEVLTAFAFAHPFMEITGDMVIAWMLLWRAATASANMKKNEKDAAFYEGQIKSSEFFTHSILPITMGKMDAVLTTNSAVVEISEDAFGGK